jgi:diaminopimelate decarboxylase
MTTDEVQAAAALLRDAGVAVKGLHFHLHTNVSHAAEYSHALKRVAQIAQVAGIEPEYVDIGGGLPIVGETPADGYAAASTFDFDEFRRFLERVPLALPSVREVWLENGRYLTGAAGAVVITVLDRKVRDDVIFLICDGGRVNHARMASIETHEILLAPMRTGALRKTVVCGPTCSAVDRLGCWMLPESVRPGDRVIWLGAGAYHIPLETRFSTGLAPVVWFNERHEPEVIRPRETPAEWWGQWAQPETRHRVLTRRSNGGRV